MQGEKRKMAILAALAVALGVKDGNHVNLFVYGHSIFRHSMDLTTSGVELYEYFNNKRKVSDWRNIFSVNACGGNADGYAIAKVGEIMLKDSKAAKKVLIVISDGEPSAYKNQQTGEAHVRMVVELLEKKGIEVIQICVDNIERSPFMFKHFIPFESNDKFIRELIRLIQKHLIRFADNI